MHSSENVWFPHNPAGVHCSCDKVNHKQEVRFLLYLLSQIVTWQYTCNPNPLDEYGPCTVINDYDWQLRNCPLPCKHNYILFVKCVIQNPNKDHEEQEALKNVERPVTGNSEAAGGNEAVDDKWIVRKWRE